jgi:hypothetical protein
MSKSSDNIHAAFITATHEVRHRLGAADIGRFSFSISADGRCLTDLSEVKIEYRISAGYDCSVTGNDLDRCITEVLRRWGWNETNAPLSLPSPTTNGGDASK